MRRRLDLISMCFGFLLHLAGADQCYCQDYPQFIVGAKVQTKWSPDRASCHIKVEIQNLKRTDFNAVPSKDKRIAFSAFPQIVNTSIISDLGSPDVPYVRVRLEIPNGARASIVLDRLEKKDEWDKLQIVPVLAPWPEIRKAPAPIPTPNEKVYGQQVFFPYGDYVHTGQVVGFRGSQVQTFHFFPLKFNPRLGIVRSYRIDATVHLAFQDSKAPDIWAEANRKKNLGYSSAFALQYTTFMEDYTPPTTELVNRPEKIEGCDYLAITDDVLVAELEPLLKLKHDRSLFVRTVTLSSLGITNKDSAESRRNKIRERIEQEYRLAPKPSYLLLLGAALIMQRQL
jgi:hypothetical protein